jgi:hypothetical protein
MPVHNTAERRATSQESLPTRCGSMAKADLHPQAGATNLRDVAAEAIRTVYPKQEAAAPDCAMSPSRLSHKLKDGSLTLRHLEQFGSEYAAEFGDALVKKYGRTNPKANAVEALKDARRELDRAIDLLTEAS